MTIQHFICGDKIEYNDSIYEIKGILYKRNNNSFIYILYEENNNNFLKLNSSEINDITVISRIPTIQQKTYCNNICEYKNISEELCLNCPCKNNNTYPSLNYLLGYSYKNCIGQKGMYIGISNPNNFYIVGDKIDINVAELVEKSSDIVYLGDLEFCGKCISQNKCEKCILKDLIPLSLRNFK